MIPPVVDALGELHGAGEDGLAGGRRTGRPRAQVDDDDEDDRQHPRQQLLISQLELVRRFHAVRQRYPGHNDKDQGSYRISTDQLRESNESVARHQFRLGFHATAQLVISAKAFHVSAAITMMANQ